jgi:hypothetical protein
MRGGSCNCLVQCRMRRAGVRHVMRGQIAASLKQRQSETWRDWPASGRYGVDLGNGLLDAQSEQ